MSEDSSASNGLLPVEREDRILGYLQGRGMGAVTELSRALGVSEATIRRDLARLAARQLVRRVHGGAVLVDGAGFEPPVLHRRALRAAEKERIGRAAAGLVKDGDTIVLLGGSTTLQVVPHLTGRRDLTLITDSLLIAERAARLQGVTLVMLGGIVRPSELSTEGYLTHLCLGQLHANKAIVGARAVNLAQGLMLEKVSEVATFRECIGIADEVILVADHTKFGQVATAVLGPLSMVHRIVTDSGMPQEMVAQLGALGIEVMLA
ncbi:MAG: DeoR/GlpR family DNA-binding transcription regulator [Anaerolineae bacterium]|nr:DeoR/GlpR family DNA-binding transcription regulator [Anaerolineae bacterium]